ncbi:MAG TPA: AraC family transcriptional regulator [Methylomirabilota bacterium]
MPDRGGSRRDGGMHRREYEKRVNRAIDHIRSHLADELTLAGLARVAAFSPFHFHRVFKAITRETVFGFVQRLRIERAAVALTIHPESSVLAVALDHGFASAATFARAFRAHFGMSATEWRDGGAARWRTRERNPGKQVRKTSKARSLGSSHTERRRKEGRTMAVHVRDLPTYHVAYMRYVGPYGVHGIPELWQKFTRWMETHGLATEGAIKLGVAYDDPSVTPPEKCRYDACVVVPASFTADRMVNIADLPGGRCAVSEFTGTARDIEAAWEHVFAAWLPGSGYEPDDRPCFEIYRGQPGLAGKSGVFRCELCLPVRPV